jgi:NodT family efflux transporter outer membrane factor (OMF) lipoprotein
MKHAWPVKQAWARLAAGSLVAILCDGCAVKPVSPPKVDVPQQWVAAHPSGTVAVTTEWFRGFGSEELDELVANAYRTNQDLAAADARVRQADARARAAGAALLPDVSAGANGVFFAGHSPNGSVTETDYAALLSASYEIDFWGKNRAARMAARSMREASESDEAVVALTMVTGIANTYFRLIAQRERVDLARQTLTNATQLLALVEARRAANLSNPVELAQQRAVVAAAEVHVKELEQQEVEQQAALAILVGKMPGTVAVDGRHLADFTPPRVSPGMPAELLARRPDVFASEASLQAAHADLLQARAAFFPSLTLTGTAGLANPSVAAAVQTLTGLGPTMSLGADVVQSIFNGGRLRAARDEALGKEQEMLAQYRGTVLSALWDVEVALSAIERLDQQEDAQKRGVEQSERALAGAQARYRAGSGDFLAVLDAQRSLVTAQEQWSQYQLARLQAAVGLCKALGGGWVQRH